MIPLKLKLKGIYSYKETQSIDFEKLISTQLFGIFGSTGSGKSSILEAITFVLYGEVERLNRNERSYNMMNLDCNEMHIALEFMAGQQGKEKFLAEVTGKRNSKNFDVINITKGLYGFTDNKWVPFPGKIEDITGLSYENFKRTIIIPQGNFQEFIQLGEKDRTEMMKKLFHLEKFDLAGKTKYLAEKNQKKLDEKETLIRSLDEYTPEFLEDLCEKIKLRETDSEKLSAVIAEAEKSYKAMLENQGLFKKIEEKKQALVRMESQAAHFETREKALQEYEYCEKNFAPLLREKNKLEGELTSLEKSINNKNTLLNEKKQNLNIRKETFREIEKNYDKRHDYKEKESELRTTAEIIEKYLEQQEERTRVAKGKLLTQSKKEELEANKKQNQALSHQISALTQSIQGTQSVREVKDWFRELKNLEERQNESIKKLEEFTQREKQLITEKEHILSVLPLNALFDGAEMEAKVLHDLMEEELTKVRAQEKEFYKKQNEWNVHLSLKQYSEELREGDPCPLCGSQHHPGITGRSNPEGKLAHIQGEITRNSQYQDTLLKARVQLEGWEKNQAENQRKIQECKAEVLRKNEETEEHRLSFRWSTLKSKSPEEIDAMLREEEIIKEKLSELNAEKEQTEKQIHKNDEELTRYEAKLKELESRENERQGYLNGKISTLKHISWEQYINTPPEVIHREAEGFQTKYSGAEDLYKSYRETIEKEEKKISEMDGEINEANNHQKDLLVEFIQTKNKLSRLIENSPFENQQKVEEILSNPLNTETIKKEIEEYKIAFGALKSEIAGLISESEGKTFVPEEMENLGKKIAEYKEEYNGIQQEIGGLGNKKKETE
ncbi:MAG: hypothetical protein K1X92_09340, partial [Bacteroidia bacterium]|nr:hypothetical protein [Bacteroidia bacterium]